MKSFCRAAGYDIFDCVYLSGTDRNTMLIEECVSFITGKAAQQITRRAREKLAPYGITPVQYAVLCVLWESSDLTAADLCSRLSMDSATITGVLDRLETANLIERRANPSDRRAHHLYLTRSGRKLKIPLTRELRKLNEEVAGELGSAAQTVFVGMKTLGSSAKSEN